MKKIWFLAFAIVIIVLSVPYFLHRSKPSQNKLPLVVNKKALNFIAIGDWGRKGNYKQKEVGDQMGITADSMDTDFFISTGDNFYSGGVKSTEDPVWKISYENIYNANSLQKNWYAVLGNHDYDGNIQAEIDYTKISKRWNMPARYYAVKLALKDDTTQKLLMIFLDTSPLVTWDEATEKTPEQEAGYKEMEEKWLDSILNDPSPDVKWKIVCGHHPLFTGSRRINSIHTKELLDLLRPSFEKYHVDAYLCGHDHSLQDIKPNGITHYFISGAGSQTTSSELYPEGGKFALSENGFIAFSLSSQKLLAQIINYKGEVLFADEIIKP